MKLQTRDVPLLALLGVGAGFLNGLLGAGGGIAIVAGLKALFGKRVPDGRSFYATAIAVMLPLTALSLWQYRKSGNLPALPPFSLILPAALGGAAGALLTRRLTPRLLGRIFAAAVLISGVIMVI